MSRTPIRQFTKTVKSVGEMTDPDILYRLEGTGEFYQVGPDGVVSGLGGVVPPITNAEIQTILNSI